MTQETNLNPITRSQFEGGPLSELVRQWMEGLLQACVLLEFESAMEATKHLKDAFGKQRIVRNGYMPERCISTTCGDLKIRLPRLRDRQGELKFNSRILPPYLRSLYTSRSALINLFLRAAATGDWNPVLSLLITRQATAALTPSAVLILKKALGTHYAVRRISDTPQHIERLWAGLVMPDVPSADAKRQTVVIIGRTTSGVMQLLELVGIGQDELMWTKIHDLVKRFRGDIERSLPVGTQAFELILRRNFRQNDYDASPGSKFPRGGQLLCTNQYYNVVGFFPSGTPAASGGVG